MKQNNNLKNQQESENMKIKGNAITKIGFSGEDLPTLEIPSKMVRNKIL